VSVSGRVWTERTHQTETHEEKNQRNFRDTPSKKSFKDDQGETRKQHNQ